MSEEEQDEEQICEDEPKSNVSSSTQKNLYEILDVESTVSQQEIKKAYYKLALRLRPDKNPGDKVFASKRRLNYILHDNMPRRNFSATSKVISILGDEEKRALYDQTGCGADADLAGDVGQNLKDFFQTLYKKITEADMEEFEAKYRGSDLEKKDLIDLYHMNKGNMHRVFCYMLCSDPKLDSHRFKDILDEAIAEGVLKSNKAYGKWAKQVSETKPPTSPLRRRRKAKEDENALVGIISQRRNERKVQMDSMFSTLASKRGGGSVAEPSEEEFEAARRKLESRKTSKRK